MSPRSLAALLAGTLLACTPPADTGDTTAPMDLGPDAARVFEINPLATPEPVDVVLPGVAADADGALTSALDAAGVRRLQVVSCVDEGETSYVMGMGVLRVCTLRQRASKIEQGDFGYEDWEPALAGEYDPDDVHAEVSLYHHASRLYDLVVDPDVGLYERLPLVHEVGGQPVPLTLVANYRAPVAGEDSPLVATDLAMHLTADMLSMGMDSYAGLLDIPGDVLAFGQGAQADFAYDGETVYHELGHVVTWSIGGLQYHVHADAYGLNNLTPALEQGITETLVSLTSGRTSLFDWLDTVSGGVGYARDLDNDDVYPENMGGIGPFDGMVVAAAHHDAWLHLQQAADLERAGFVRLLLLSLEANVEPDLAHSFQRWAEIFLGVMEAEGLGEHGDAVRSLFEARGLLETVRARSLEGLVGMDAWLVVGGAAQAAWNTWLEVEIEGEQVAIGTAYVQAWAPAGTGALEIEASIAGVSGEMASDPMDWDPLLLVRSGEPVYYEHHDDGTSTVTADRVVAPEIAWGASSASVTWTVEGLDPAVPSYLHVINRGDAAFVLMVQE
jgi:hypothetical protein